MHFVWRFFVLILLPVVIFFVFIGPARAVSLPRHFHLTSQEILTLVERKEKIMMTPQKEAPTSLSVTPTPTTDVLVASHAAVRNYIMQDINDYRSSLGLSKVATSSATCAFAQVRAEEIASDFSHNGFTKRVDDKTLPYTYSKVTENIAQTDNYKNVVTFWMNSSEHSANMRADTPFVCVAYFGNFYAYEGMKP